MTAQTPLYEHDCERCWFVGTDHRMIGEPMCNGVDMYVCGTTVIRRYSSDGPDYGSMDTYYAKMLPNRYQRVLDHAKELLK